MKTRDRIVSLVLVGAVIGGIWWAGVKWRGGDVVASDGEADASSDAGPAPSTSAVATTDGSAPSPLPDASLEAAVVSGACRAMNIATTKKLDEAKKARTCTPDFDTSMLACHTSQNAATWGLRVDDVVDISASSDGIDTCATGWLVRLVHLDVDGVESVVVPGIAAKLRAHTYNVTQDTRIAEVAFFDWDGDGDDEVLVRATRGQDEQRATVWAF